MSRSLRVHPDHKSAISAALERNGFLTQGDLAANLFVALSTVNNFCRGIKVSVAKFEQICEALGLEPRELILPKDTQTTSQPAQRAEHSAQSHFFAYDPFWVGRADLVRDLTTQLNNTCRLMLITGIAGVGKTALAERLSVELTENSAHFKRHTLRENFDNEEQPTNFASVAARLLEKCGQPVSPEDRANPQQLARQLIAHLQTTPTLILIDSLEKILQGNPATGRSEFIDEGFVSFFKAILATDTFQSRFILTSQEVAAQILEVGSRYLNFWHQQPIRGLSEAEQQSLFEKTGFTLTDTLTRIGKAYEGHPLALRTILGEIGSHPFYGNARAYWKRYGQEIEAVEKAIEEAAAGNTVGADDKWQLDRFTRALRRNVQQRLEYTFERLQQDARYAYILLCESAVYRCPVPEDWWLSHLEDWTAATLSPQESKAVQIAALDVLRDRYLVEEMTEETELLLKQHNLIRSTSLAHLENLQFTS
ncbi:MAG: helix-turn-helix domain-containing protein [Cyanobacteria bacterium J06634_5]